MESESRDRLVLEATRQALVADARRARRSIPSGILAVGVGAGIAAAGLMLPIGPFPTMAIGILGLTIVPFGIAVLARSAYTIASAPRRIRALDIQTLPPARLVVRD